MTVGFLFGSLLIQNYERRTAIKEGFAYYESSRISGDPIFHYGINTNK